MVVVEIEKKHHVKISPVPERPNLFEVGNIVRMNISAVKQV